MPEKNIFFTTNSMDSIDVRDRDNMKLISETTKEKYYIMYMSFSLEDNLLFVLNQKKKEPKKKPEEENGEETEDTNNS